MNPKNIKWNEVTWYSKLGAIIFFLIVVPILTFVIGMKYQEVNYFASQPLDDGALNQDLGQLPFAVGYQDFATTTAVYEIQGSYPIIQGKNSPQVNNAIKNELDAIVLNYVGSLYDGASLGITSIDISATTTHSETYGSVSFLLEVFVTSNEMAHPYLERFAYSYDLNSGEKKEVSDILNLSTDEYLKNISLASRKILTKKFIEGDDFITQEFQKGTEARSENYKKVVVGEKGVTVYFDEYQIGPRSVGAPVIDITFNELK